MSTQAIRRTVVKQAARTETWMCYACEQLVPDAELFLVGNKTTGEAIVLHRTCCASLLKPRVSRTMGTTRRKRRAL